MKHERRVRVTASLAAVAAAGAVGLAAPAPLQAADPPWDPPPCPPGASAPAAGSTWYSLEPVLDADGWLAGRSLRLGALGGGPVRRIDLPPESFASGPVGGFVLVGDDDGKRSRLRLVDVRTGCATELAGEGSVVRSALPDPEGGAVWEHRVDRATRADQGVWRRPMAGGDPVRVLPGIEPDDGYGPTFTTELQLGADGRLAVTSCGERRCRVRVLDPASGQVLRASDTGPLLGIAGDRAVAYAPCHGFPCAVEAVDLRDGHRRTLATTAGPAALAPDGRTLVHERADGALVALDLATMRRATVGARGEGLPVRPGSHATSGATLPAGWLLLAPGGHLADLRRAFALDVSTGTIGRPWEVEP